LKVDALLHRLLALFQRCALHCERRFDRCGVLTHDWSLLRLIGTTTVWTISPSSISNASRSASGIEMRPPLWTRVLNVAVPMLVAAISDRLLGPDPPALINCLANSVC